MPTRENRAVLGASMLGSCELVGWWDWPKYGRLVIFISYGADDECGVRKQTIAVIRCLRDKDGPTHIKCHFSYFVCE